MTFLKELRDAAAKCSKIEYLVKLRDSADVLEQAIRQLYVDPTVSNMQAVNCYWANAKRILDNMPAEGDPAPLSGTPEAARLAA